MAVDPWDGCVHMPDRIDTVEPFVLSSAEQCAVTVVVPDKSDMNYSHLKITGVLLKKIV